MKKVKYILLILGIFILIIVGNVIAKDLYANTLGFVNVCNSNSDSIPNWKTYTNRKLGYSFQYPDTWTKNGEESNAINRKGEVMSISVNFINTISNSNLYIEYHLAPFGPEIYKLADDKYISSKKSKKSDTQQITVAGNNAVKTYTTMRKDIHGNIYDPVIILIQIVFLDKQKTGGFNLNFKTPAPNSKAEITKFNQMISSFKFINKLQNK